MAKHCNVCRLEECKKDDVKKLKDGSAEAKKLLKKYSEMQAWGSRTRGG